MSKTILNHKQILRLIDANCNRLKEGLRVTEDIVRFVAEDEKLTRRFKNIRHQITQILNQNPTIKTPAFIKERRVESDVGKASTLSEFKRKNIQDIFLANIQRVKESIRVLEEFFKLYDRKTALRFKALRYKIYAQEKHALNKFNR